MSSITSLLSRSQSIKTVYEFGRRKISESYRRAHRHRDSTLSLNPGPSTSKDIDYGFRDRGIVDGGFDLVPHPEARNPVLTRADVTDCWARFVADPFVVYADGIYHMFFEIKSMGGHVFIGHAFSKDGLDYEYNRIIIQPEIAQHTYPHVFKHKGDWLMIPSPGSNVNGQFRIYEATDFPTGWRLRETPIRRGVRLDPTPILYEGTWYLLYQEVGSYDVVLKYADSLTGPWRLHPDSPVFPGPVDRIETCSIGSAEMVPSGRPLYDDGEVHLFYRSHTDRSVYHYHVTELNEQSFVQERYTDTPVFEGQNTEVWNCRFMHTVNPVYPWDGAADIVAVDGLEANRYRWSIGIYTSNSPTLA